MLEFMYPLHWAFVSLALFSSWWRFRDLLHPHFLFTVALCTMFFSDFLVRGYNVPNLARGIGSDLYLWQLLVLGVCCAMLLISGFLSRRATGPLFSPPAPTLEHARAAGRGLIVGWTLLFSEVLKRLAATGWQPAVAIDESLGPRGGRAWQSKLVYVGDESFLFALIGALLPFAGVVFAYALVFLKGWTRFWAGVGLLAVLALLLSSGDRTPLVFVLGSLVILVIHTRWSMWLRSAMVAGILLLAAVSLSVMYLYRGEGLSHLLADGNNAAPPLVYHQDDSYYWALSAIDISDRTSLRWDWEPFFGAALLNPIPRFFWPDKPLLLKSFWGQYKPYWITITYLGELAAMFGPWGAGLLGIVFGVGLFLILGWSVKAVTRQWGLLFYLVMALYVYMVMRSLLNLTQFIYLPLMSWWAVMIYIPMGARRGVDPESEPKGARA